MGFNLHNYRNKKVFLTGHTGFKGGWLLATLNYLGAKTTGYALSPQYKKGIYTAINGNAKCKSVIADIRNRRKLEKEILNFKPDFIFHLAAQPLVRASFLDPPETFDVNIMGTANILEAVRKLKKKCSVVVVTTDKVYKNYEKGIPFVENSRLGGHDPYSASKACAELLVESYACSFFGPGKNPKVRLATARAGNVIGGGDFSEDRIIPDFVKALTQNRILNIRNPNSVRPWQHVMESTSGYLLLGLLLNSGKHYSQAYNFGPHSNAQLTVKEVIDRAIDTWGSGAYHVASLKTKQEAGILKLNTRLAQKEIGWKPKLSFGKALAWTAEWYQSNDPACITEKQISAYLRL